MILLIDLSHLFWTNWHATADLETGEAFNRTIQAVWALEPHAYDKAVLCLDMPPYWRKEVSPSYKAQREKPEPVALEQFDRVKAELGRQLPLAGAKGFEADDIIATLVKQATEPVVIATNDKDLMQLVTDDVTVLSVRTRERFGPSDVFGKFGVPPNRIRQWLALMGDSSDNIQGVKGCGPKKAAWLLENIGDIDDIHASVDDPEDTRITPALRKALAEAYDAGLIESAYQLIRLRDDAPVNLEELEVSEPEETTHEPAFDNAPLSEPPEPEPEETPEPVAIVRAQETAMQPAQSFEMGLEPANLRDAFKLASALHDSRLYGKFPNAEAVFATIIRGRELGLGALTSLDNFHVVKGKPVMDARLIQARAEAHARCQYFMFVDGNDLFATYETKHRDHPKASSITYTIEEAKAAGLVKPDSGWTKHPSDMLAKTAAVKLARRVYPGAVAGLYCAEEMGD